MFVGGDSVSLGGDDGRGGGVEWVIFEIVVVVVRVVITAVVEMDVVRVDGGGWDGTNNVGW